MKWIHLKTATAADAGPPTLASDGVDLPAGQLYSDTVLSTLSVGTLRIASTAGSAAVSIAGRMWGYFPAVDIPAGGTVPARWAPLGTSDDGTDLLRGMVNAGFAIGEISGVADQVDFVEQISGWDMATRLCFQVTAVTGTLPTFQVVFGSPTLSKD